MKPMTIVLVAASAVTLAHSDAIVTNPNWSIHSQTTPADWQVVTQGKNLAFNCAVVLRPLPNYPPTQDADDAKQLTDGKLGQRTDMHLWDEKPAVGWSYRDYVRIVIDLGQVKPVGKVVARLQTAIVGNDVTFRSLILSLSEDGQDFHPVRNLLRKVHPDDNPAFTFAPIPPTDAAIHAFSLDSGYSARYVRLDFATTQHLVCDEIAVLQAEDHVKALPARPKVEKEYEDNVFDRRDRFQKLIAPGNLIAGKELKYAPQPTYPLTTNETDHFDLTDGNLGVRPDERIWFEPGAVCWHGPPLVTIFADLGSPRPVDSVVIRLLGGGEQGSLFFPDELRVLLSNDGKDYYLASSRHRRGLDDLTPGAWDLPEEDLAWIHNFRLPVGKTARYVAIQMKHQKQFFCSDEIAVVKDAVNLPAFVPSPAKKVEIVTSGVAFSSHHAKHPICENMPLRTKVNVLDARSGKDFGTQCKLILDLPETVKFITKDYTPEQVAHNGRIFSRYTIPYRWRRVEDFQLQSLLPPGKTDVLYMYADSGKGLENERKITWESIHIEPVQPPKRLHVSLAWSNAEWLYDHWPNYLENTKKLGFNCVACFPRYWKESDVPKNQSVLHAARDAGMEVIVNESPAGALEEDRNQKETKSELATGPSDNVCPAYRGQFYQKELASFAKHAVWCKPNYIFYDIEAYWNGAYGADQCERCKQRFAEGKFKTWDEFRAAMGREIHVDIKNATEKALANAGIKQKVTYGSYRTEPVTPLNDGLFKFDTLYPDLLQLAMPSLYVAGNQMAVADNISSNRARMETNDIIPWLSTGCYGEYDPVHTRDMILEAFANGARGITYYCYGDFDPLHFKYHAEAVGIVAQVEDILADGAPVRGLSANNPRIRVCGMGKGDEMVVLVSNYQGLEPGTRVRLALPVKARAHVWDLHSRRKIGEVSPGKPLEVTLNDMAARMSHVSGRPR